MDSRIVANKAAELFEPLLDSLPSCVVISNAMQSDLEAPVSEIQYEPQIFRIL